MIKQDRHAELVAQAHQQLEDLRLDGDVERRGGLVGDQELRVAGERHRDHDPLAQPARELVRILREAPLRRADPDHAQQLEHPRADRGTAQLAMQAQRLADLKAHRKGRVQAGHRLLKDHADAVAAHIAHRPLVERQQVLAVERDPPALDRAGGQGRSRMIARAVTLLPQPHSPTRPTIRPASTVNDSPSTTRAKPRSV